MSDNTAFSDPDYRLASIEEVTVGSRCVGLEEWPEGWRNPDSGPTFFTVTEIKTAWPFNGTDHTTPVQSLVGETGDGRQVRFLQPDASSIWIRKDSAFEQARSAYHNANTTMQNAAEAETWRIVLEHCPNAASFTTEGSYELVDDDAECRLRVTAVHTTAGEMLDHDALCDIEEALDKSEALLFLGDLGGPTYIGTHVFEKDADTTA